MKLSLACIMVVHLSKGVLYDLKLRPHATMWRQNWWKVDSCHVRIKGFLAVSPHVEGIDMVVRRCTASWSPADGKVSLR